LVLKDVTENKSIEIIKN